MADLKNFRRSNKWVTKENGYMELKRDDYYVTIQPCPFYYNVYIERHIEHQGCVSYCDKLEHRYNYVKSLEAACYLWEIAWSLELFIDSPEDFFLTQEEWNSFRS